MKTTLTEARAFLLKHSNNPSRLLVKIKNKLPLPFPIYWSPAMEDKYRHCVIIVEEHKFRMRLGEIPEMGSADFKNWYNRGLAR